MNPPPPSSSSGSTKTQSFFSFSKKRPKVSSPEAKHASKKPKQLVVASAAATASAKDAERMPDLLDPTLVGSPYGSCLVIGKSGTGKTTLLRSVVDLQLKRPEVKRLFVFNDKDNQYDRGKKLSSFADLRAVPPHSMVILEDVIVLRKREEDILRLLLNFDCHHKKIHAFVVAHHVYKTSLLNMLPFFHYIIFTSHKSNAPLVKVCLSSFHLDKAEMDKIVNFVQSSVDERSDDGYFVFDCTSLNFYRAPYFESLLPDKSAGEMQPVAGESLRATSRSSDLHSHQASLSASAAASTSTSTHASDESRARSSRHGTSSASSSDKLLEKFKFFSDGVERPQAQFLLRMILNCLPQDLVRGHDLTFAFQRKNGSDDRVSVVDYVVSLLDETSPPVDKKLLFFHRYLSKHCCVPSFFQKNKNFKT